MTIPHEISEYQLKKVGVRIVNPESLTIGCSRCAQSWTIRQKGLRLPKGYWKCPRGCNSPERNSSQAIDKDNS